MKLWTADVGFGPDMIKSSWCAAAAAARWDADDLAKVDSW